jgi:hypothetical protein
VGGWRRLHNEKLHNLYATPNLVRVIKWKRIRWASHIARMIEMRNSYKILVGKSVGKRLLEGPRYRWEDNIRMNLREIG